MMQQSPFQDFLEEHPESGYYGYLEGQGFNRSKKRHLQGLLGQLQQNFMGQLGQQIIQGDAPTKKWMDFVGNTDLNKLYGSMSPRSRGMSQSSLTPRTRHLYRRF